jgi:hypothetical protein
MSQLVVGERCNIKLKEQSKKMVTFGGIFMGTEVTVCLWQDLVVCGLSN